MERLESYLSDVLTMEREIHTAVKLQLGRKFLEDQPGTRRLLERTTEQSAKHAGALQEYLKGARALTGAVKGTFGAVIGSLIGLTDRARMEHRISRTLRDIHASLNLAASSYEMLFMTSVVCEQKDIGDLALCHLADYTDLIGDVDVETLNALATELAHDGRPVSEARFGEILAQLREAWKPKSARANVP